jgi:hypothetical protein
LLIKPIKISELMVILTQAYQSIYKEVAEKENTPLRQPEAPPFLEQTSPGDAGGG